MGWLGERCRRFFGHRSGSTTILFGVAAPTLMIFMAAGVDYGRLVSASSALQEAVDQGALMGATELGSGIFSDQQIDSHVRASVYAAAYSVHPGVRIEQAVITGRSVQATAWIDFQFAFGDLVGLKSQRLTRTATASIVGQTQLCALTLDTTAGNSFSLTGSARLTAPQCSTDANSTSPSGLAATGSAFLQSSRSCVVGGYGGNSANYSPLPKTGCPSHPDPLSTVVPPTADLSGCTKNLAITTTTTLQPGTFCGGITVNGSAVVTLSPGTYIINGGDFHLTSSSQLHGQNVAIYFNGSTGTFKADAQTTIDLTAPKTGNLAGFLMYQDGSANAGQDFHISSTQANNLLGTIYLPKGKLTVDSANKVADQSAYTVIVAQQLIVNGTANLTLNAMYTSTDVPVPKGVGPSGGIVALTH